MKGALTTRLRVLFCALFLALFLSSALAADPGAAVSKSGKTDRDIEFLAIRQVLPKMVSPAAGLIAAIGLTHLLQRRRNAQVQAWARIDR